MLPQGLASSLADRLGAARAPAGLLEGVGQSCLVPLLVSQLGTASFADMCSRWG